MTLNKILIIGNVGRDPEMRYTPNGNPVTSFSVATSRRYTTQGEQREETEWFRISAWNRLAETCNQYVTKGMKVYVEGRLSSNEWVGQDGEKRFGLEITASEVKFLNRPGDADSGGDQGGDGGGGGYTPSGPASNEVEDLPW